MKKLLLFLSFYLFVKTIHSLEVSVDVTSGQTIDIFWKYSNEENITDFEVTVTPQSSEDTTEVQKITLSSNHSLPIKIEGLTPGGEYELRLSSINFFGMEDRVDYKRSGLEVYKKFTTKPSPPKDPLFCHCSEQKIDLIWEKSDPPNIFDNYLASINPSLSPRSSQLIDKYQDRTVFEMLVPGREYNLTVQTNVQDNNRIGKVSDPVKITCRTMPAPPTSVWYDPNTLSTHSFDILWGTPRLQSEFDSYLVIKDEILFKKTPKGDPRVIHFSEGTKPGKTYKIEVNTRSEQISSKPIICNVTTRPLPLSSLTHRPGNSSDILLDWTVSPESTQDSFMVSFWEVNNYILKESVRVINRTSWHLLNLLSGRNYSIAVTALSHNISSIPPTIVYQPTRPAQPLIYTIEQISDSVLNISWIYDHKSNQTHFKISSTRVDTNETKPFYCKDYWFLIYVYPGAKYEINVSSISLGLRSIPSSIVFKTNPKAPRSISIEFFNSSSIGVEWDPPIESLVDYYIVRYRSSEQKEWQELSQTKETFTEIKVLKENINYFIRVTSVSNGIESSEHREIQLKPNITTTSNNLFFY